MHSRISVRRSVAPLGGGTINADSVQAAVGELDGIVKKGMDSTTVPGVAVAVVHQGKVLAAKGYGLREVGKPDAVDADTVFQLASVSKPLGASALAAAVTQGKLSWNDPIQQGLPTFQLADPWVSSQVTIADMCAHRSGLPASLQPATFSRTSGTANRRSSTGCGWSRSRRSGTATGTAITA